MVYLTSVGFWSNAQSAITAFGSFLLYIVFAHFLAPETYGTYQYLLSVFSILTAVTLTGMNTAVTRAVARGAEGVFAESIRLQLRYGIIAAIAGLGVSGYYYSQGNLLLALGGVIIGFGAPLVYAFNTYSAFLTGKKDFRRNSIYTTSATLIYYGALAAVGVYSDSVLLLLFVNLFSQAVLYAYLCWRTFRIYRPNGTVDKESIRYGFHLSAMSVFSSVAAQIDNVLTFHFLGPVALAVYSFATAIPDRLGSMCFRFLGTAALPRFSEREPETVRATLLRKAVLGMAAAGIGVVVYWFLASWFFATFFPAYMNAVPYSVAYAVTAIFSTGAILPSTALAAAQKTRALYIHSFCTSTLQIIAPLLGVISFGLWGIVFGKIFSSFSSMLISGILAHLFLRSSVVPDQRH
ncbi:MAG TPA: oligosaccharide flippase family protein [Candidatus Paceibacterota bacterium]|nr:oligosaccharide flippase family protein [Candidatus Paceibacterota bacterium]